MLLAMIDRLTCFFATSVYPEGQGVNRDLLYYNITSKPLKILANGNINGIDINKFSKYSVKPESLNWLIEKYGITSKSFVFIFIGRLVGDKGINELITAFTIISETNPNIKLLLVGCLEPELDQLSTQTIKTIRKSPQIIEAGFQEDVLPYLNISDVLVFPSYREGFPNVVLQAGAMDLPCIVTDINGCNEIIIDGENGIIIPPKDADALYSAMESFLVNPELQEKLAKNAREMVVNRYEQSVVWEAIKGEYDYWLAKKGLL